MARQKDPISIQLKSVTAIAYPVIGSMILCFFGGNAISDIALLVWIMMVTFQAISATVCPVVLFIKQTSRFTNLYTLGQVSPLSMKRVSGLLRWRCTLVVSWFSVCSSGKTDAILDIVSRDHDNSYVHHLIGRM